MRGTLVDKGGTHQIFIGKLEGKTPPEWPRHTRDDDPELDLSRRRLGSTDQGYGPCEHKE